MDNLKKIKANFKDPNLYDQALTHRSWINENPDIRESNERLEFLGDAVLEFVVSDELYKRFPEEEEGFLTNLRANIVNTLNLSVLASRLEISEHIFLSRGERQAKGSNNPSLMADTVEAIIGAIYLDQGYDASSEFIHTNLLADIEEKLKSPLKDPKSRLQEKVQAQGLTTPIYEVIAEEGPDHFKKFTVQVSVGKDVMGTGFGRSKNQAQQEAAAQALTKLE
jgi:ribonuclease III